MLRPRTPAHLHVFLLMYFWEHSSLERLVNQGSRWRNRTAGRKSRMLNHKNRPNKCPCENMQKQIIQNKSVVVFPRASRRVASCSTQYSPRAASASAAWRRSSSPLPASIAASSCRFCQRTAFTVRNVGSYVWSDVWSDVSQMTTWHKRNEVGEKTLFFAFSRLQESSTVAHARDSSFVRVGGIR